MACALPPPLVIFTKEAENFMRLVQLLRGPGCTALQNVLVQYSTQKYTQPSFDKVLLDPRVKAILTNLVGKGKPLTKGQWLTLYGRHFPQENIHRLGKPETFDITLTFLLVRKICGLAPPKSPPGSPPGTKPSWDTEPIPADTSLEANLACIKFYRNHLCHHETGEILDHEFNATFDTLKQAIVDVSTTLSLLPPQWSVSPVDLERFRIDSISQEDKKELDGMWKDWRQQDKDIFDKLESMRIGQKQQAEDQIKFYETQMGQLKIIQKSIEGNLRQNVSSSTATETLRQEIITVQKQLCDYYLIHMSYVQRLPTDEHDTMVLKDVFVKMAFTESIIKNTKKEVWCLEHYREAFNIAQKGSNLLVEGEPGMGKTTFVKKVSIDWVDVIENKQENVVRELKEFALLFVISLRFVDKNNSLASIIIDQHDLQIEKENLEKILKTHDSILLVLDGYDEYSAGTCPQIDAIIERKLFKNITVLMTSRPYKSTKFEMTQKFFQFHFKIEGFQTVQDIEEFVQKYFQDESKADSFVIDIEESDLFELSKVPIMLLILCLLFEEGGQSLPSDQHVLYWKLMNWFYMRYRAKGGQCNMPLRETLLKVGKVALQGLLKGQLLFERNTVEKELGSEVFEIGFLTSEKIRGFTTANISVSFPHKSIQDYVAGYYLANSDDGWDMLNNIPQKELVKYFKTDNDALTLALKISELCLPQVLGLFNPLHDKGIFDFSSKFKNEDWIRDGLHTDMAFELYCHYSLMADFQCGLSSKCFPNPIVINTRNLDPTDAVSSPLPKVLSSGTLTAADIVDGSETVLACVRIIARYQYAVNKELFAFVLLTHSKLITICCKEKTVIEDHRKVEIWRCLIECGLEGLLVLGLSNCNYSMLEIREMCHKSKDIRVLDLSECSITEDMTSDVCEVVVKQSNICYLNVSGNEDVDWEYLFACLQSSNLNTLTTLGLRDCNIQNSIALILAAFIKAQRDLVSLDLSDNDDLANMSQLLIEIVPYTPLSIFNLVSLSLEPISSEQSETLKSAISCSPNLRELSLCDCQCDVSKEIIEKQCLEILNISDNDAWVTSENESDDKPLDVGYVIRNIDKLKKLQRIFAWRCCIGDDIMDHLIQNLHKNPKLTWIEFGHNPISEDKANILRSTCDWVDFWGYDNTCDIEYYYMKHYKL